MCIGSNSVNQAQDLMTVTKIEDLPNSLLPIIGTYTTQLYISVVFGDIRFPSLKNVSKDGYTLCTTQHNKLSHYHYFHEHYHE